MDTLPEELIIMIASSNPVAFTMLSQISREVNNYVNTPSGREHYLKICRGTFVDDDSFLTYSLITDNMHSFFDEPSAIYADGRKEWHKNDVLHRIGGPAIEYPDGGEKWIVDGFHHRIGGPAIKHANGYVAWMQHDKMHRIGGPAVSYSNGRIIWYENGLMHRIGGPALITEEGTMIWCHYGKIHRMGGSRAGSKPAIIKVDGSLEYWCMDKRHRTDGPAFIRANGTVEYWVNGKLHRVGGPALITAGVKTWCINGQQTRIEISAGCALWQRINRNNW